MENIANRLTELHRRIHSLEREYGRQAGSVQLLAVSKKQPVEQIRKAAGAGQHAFGENYLQEALPKMDDCADLGLEWHFIGPLQSNKTRDVAARFDWVHSLDREKIARRLSAARPAALPPLNVCLQVNVSGESSKAGIGPDQAATLAGVIDGLPNLRLRGLMTLPAPAVSMEQQRLPFRLLHDLQADLTRQGLTLDTLSMGTTADMAAAIAEGATMVRIGTALFGPREPGP